MTPPVEGASALATAAGERRRVRLRYRSARGEETSRAVDPYAVLRAVASGPWEFGVLLGTEIEDPRDLAWTARLLAGLSCQKDQSLGEP